jgi:hypothetical protein
MEIDQLSEVYAILKQYIHQKDRQEAADNLISVLVDLLNDQEITEFAQTDSYLTKSLKEYSFVDEDEYNEDDE